MKNSGETLTFTAILVEDPKSKGCTAFFAQFPYIIAEGETDKVAIKNLWSLVHDAFNHQKNGEIQAVEAKGNSVKTISFDLAEVA